MNLDIYIETITKKQTFFRFHNSTKTIVNCKCWYGSFWITRCNQITFLTERASEEKI